MEVFLGIFLETVLEPKNKTPGWLGCGRMQQDAARMRPGCGRIWIRPGVPPSVQIPYRNLCRMSCRKGLETPLAACLAAGAGGLGSLEALAVHPWGLEFLYAAMF